MRAQTRRTLENVRAVLEAGGASVEDVIMFRVYLTAREHFPALNEVYQEFLAEHVPSGQLPCRTTVFVQLPARGDAGRDRRAGRGRLEPCPADHHTRGGRRDPRDRL